MVGWVKVAHVRGGSSQTDQPVPSGLSGSDRVDLRPQTRQDVGLLDATLQIMNYPG